MKLPQQSREPERRGAGPQEGTWRRTRRSSQSCRKNLEGAVPHASAEERVQGPGVGRRAGQRGREDRKAAWDLVSCRPLVAVGVHFSGLWVQEAGCGLGGAEGEETADVCWPLSGEGHCDWEGAGHPEGVESQRTLVPCFRQMRLEHVYMLLRGILLTIPEKTGVTNRGAHQVLSTGQA